MQLDLKAFERDLKRDGFSFRASRTSLITELREARSALQRVVEEANPQYSYSNLHGTEPALKGPIKAYSVLTSTIEAAREVLERVKD